MAYNKNPEITPFEGSTLAQARQAVLRAFEDRDEDAAWEALCVLYISTSKIGIMEACEKTVKRVEEEIERLSSKSESGPADQYARANNVKRYKHKANLEFYKQIMLLFAEFGLTEYDTVKPRELNTGQRLTSGPSR
jgi:hypothetical protein